MIKRCFECKHVNTNIEYECGSGVGDYFCLDCAKRNDFICPLCGSDLIPIDQASHGSNMEDGTDVTYCQYCERLLKTEWNFCPYCSKKL